MHSSSQIVKFAKKEAATLTDEQEQKLAYQAKNEKLERSRKFARCQKARNRHSNCFDESRQPEHHRRINRIKH